METESWKQRWGTPHDLVERLKTMFGSFDLDVAAEQWSAKAPQYYDREQDGLSLPWFGTVFLQPPYRECKRWVEHAIAHRTAPDRIIALLPARTEARFFHQCFEVSNELIFLQGRVKHVRPPDAPRDADTKDSPRFASMIVVFRKRIAKSGPKISRMLAHLPKGSSPQVVRAGGRRDRR